MQNYQQYLENQEKDEERNGLDLDHDKEKGEPKAHQQAVKKAKADMIEFFETRKKGAAKIATEAKAKGGPSMLTAWHFAAKRQPYTEVIAAIKSDKNEAFYLAKCNELVRKLKFKNLKQESFQETIGKLEVWGEAISQLFN